MTNLFVDCDDTLALYCIPDTCSHGNTHPYGSKFSPWSPNDRLVKGIKAFRQNNQNSLIVVWSGGGKEYAQTFIDKLLPDLEILAMDKWYPFTDLVGEGDIVVDDCPLETKGTLYDPREWPPVGEV